MTVRAAAVIGLGRIGAAFEDDPLRSKPASHAGAYLAHPRAELIGGVDPDAGQRARFEERFGAPAFASADELFAVARPEVVSVCVPPAAHADVVADAVARGAGRVICEKPCCPDLPSAVALVERLGDDAVRVGVNYTRRYDPLHRRLLGLVAAEGLNGGTGRYTAGILNTASHWLASLLAAGAHVTEVLAVPAVDAPDPSPSLVLRLEGGATVYLEGHDVADYLVFEADLTTPQARVQLLDSGARGRYLERRPSDQFSGYNELFESAEVLPDGLVGPMLPVIDDALGSLDEGRPMACTIHDAVAVHAVIAAAERSLADGNWAGVPAR